MLPVRARRESSCPSSGSAAGGWARRLPAQGGHEAALHLQQPVPPVAVCSRRPPAVVGTHSQETRDGSCQLACAEMTARAARPVVPSQVGGLRNSRGGATTLQPSDARGAVRPRGWLLPIGSARSGRCDAEELRTVGQGREHVAPLCGNAARWWCLAWAGEGSRRIATWVFF
jgi:hypothetical protein